MSWGYKLTVLTSTPLRHGLRFQTQAWRDVKGTVNGLGTTLASQTIQDQRVASLNPLLSRRRPDGKFWGGDCIVQAIQRCSRGLIHPTG